MIQHLLQVSNTVVADTDASNFALFLRINTSPPALPSLLRTANPRMKQIKIDIFEPTGFEGHIDLLKGVLVRDICHEFRRVEDFRPGYTGVLHESTYNVTTLLFVVIPCCRVLGRGQNLNALYLWG